jgi:hypothetical protein
LLWRVAGRLVEEGQLGHLTWRVKRSGLEEVKQSMEFVRAGGLSGEKIVIVFGRKREMGGWNVMARAERAAKKA